MAGDQVGRGAGKLTAALSRFGLEERVRGAQAVDVGASVGGFTQVLLQHGAARVTAVDVGRGQLHEQLRRDARVESLEETNWKTLSLTIAPGPFSFFTVDVSFVAARTMLRSLAFRLAEGAEGVVLVKPQFELPDRLVRGGDVSDPALRARALRAFTAKAESLGFAVLATVDSPVAGGSGTVEILAHLRFGGRPAALPQPGEKKPARVVKRARHSSNLAWFVVAAPGLEGVVEDEVRELVPEARAVLRVPGGVSFSGPLAAGMRANLELRVATRVLVRLGEVEARQFSELRRRMRALPWSELVPPGRPLRVDAAASRCRLYHTGALEETAALAAGDAVGPLPEGEEGTRILVRGENDRFTISVDASGELLHRRGWREETGPAPLRETLAAGILRLAEHDPELPFVDPMCGAGTIVLEACARALRLAPGLARSFAFERWPCFDAAAWDRLRDEALERILPEPPAPLYAFDRDEEAVAITRRNARRGGLLGHISVERAELGTRPAPARCGLVVVNPPYGRRLPGAGRELGPLLRGRYGGWRVAVLAPGKSLPGFSARASHALKNGGLRVHLLVNDLAVPAPQAAAGYH
jgi:putative N6-adenine-specific DNA methylase